MSLEKDGDEISQDTAVNNMDVVLGSFQENPFTTTETVDNMKMTRQVPGERYLAIMFWDITGSREQQLKRNFRKDWVSSKAIQQIPTKEISHLRPRCLYRSFSLSRNKKNKLKTIQWKKLRNWDVTEDKK